MQAGTLIDYSLRLHGLPIRWRTRIESWNPPFDFVDRQLRRALPNSGSIRIGSLPKGNSGTRMFDTIRYALSWGVLGTIAHCLMVRSDLKKIFFDYRADRVGRFLGGRQGDERPFSRALPPRTTRPTFRHQFFRNPFGVASPVKKCYPG